jgi:hypothetical protein
MWWQLGFEGRRIFSEAEFLEGSREVSYPVKYTSRRVVRDVPKKETYSVWTRDDVPILLRNVDIGGESVPCFLTVKPMSHYDSGGNGWRTLEYDRESGKELSLNLRPHVRGVVIEQTSEFLFWHPFVFGSLGNQYETRATTLDGSPVFISPVHSGRFCRNLLDRSWHSGKRAQTSGKILDTAREGVRLVPYYEFDSLGDCVSVYPISLFEGRLDVPGIMIGRSNSARPELAGVGFVNYRDGEEVGEHLRYWEIDKSLKRKGIRSLERRLGKLKTLC